MKPIVGVMPLWDDEKESIWMLPGYMDGIHHAGGIPIILPFSTDESGGDKLRHLQVVSGFHGNRDICDLPVDGFLSTG